jgi:hypothetical protein
MFGGLFDSEPESDENPFGSDRGGSRFLEIYGWHYTIYEIAKLHNITAEVAWEMRAIEYLNALAYMKAERDFKRTLN